MLQAGSRQAWRFASWRNIPFTLIVALEDLPYEHLGRPYENGCDHCCGVAGPVLDRYAAGRSIRAIRRVSYTVSEVACVAHICCTWLRRHESWLLVGVSTPYVLPITLTRGWRKILISLKILRAGVLSANAC
jgi:hypothetical protein